MSNEHAHGVHTSRSYLDEKFAEMRGDISALHLYVETHMPSERKTHEKLDRIWKNMPRSTKRSRAGRRRPPVETSRPESRPAPTVTAIPPGATQNAPPSDAELLDYYRKTIPEEAVRVSPKVADELFQQQVLKGLQNLEQGFSKLGARVQQLEMSRGVNLADVQAEMDALLANNGQPAPSM